MVGLMFSSSHRSELVLLPSIWWPAVAQPQRKPYGEWANEAHTRGSLQNMHNITTHLCEIDGDEAHAESYVIGLFLNKDGKTSRILAGRYADRLERRDGVWGIVLRRSTVEIALVGDASFLASDYFREMGFVNGMRDKRDVTYQRPLTLDETPADRWS
jgi:hypothetical protein